ncbi:hypothetical protein HMPREF9225_1810 [Peptoniphilus duerdenii ATCC BAA-1640]|uniref:Uncharacterized protein n=1 Tax=Peptoniphilus duerdenii ATCC BAA-1640 TaxID=862517 RepID=E0NNS1_9FIRM|nr:hypothetical protein HMPREF9225_1810 [Peptoniphilus duerdenii ATCC BAA-1640]
MVKYGSDPSTSKAVAFSAQDDHVGVMTFYNGNFSWENVVISLMEAVCFRYGAVAKTRSVEVIPVRLGNKFPRSG